jgi:hypothetical protein
MKRKDTINQLIFKSEDGQGAFEFRVLRNCRQVQLESGMGWFSKEVYINVDAMELKAIRDMLSEVIDETEGREK